MVLTVLFIFFVICVVIFLCFFFGGIEAVIILFIGVLVFALIRAVQLSKNKKESEDYIDMGKYVDYNAHKIYEKARIQHVKDMLEVYGVLSYSEHLITKIPISKVTGIHISDNRGEYYDIMVRGWALFSPLRPKKTQRFDKFCVVITWDNGRATQVAGFAFCMPDAIAEARATHAANELVKICGLPQVTKIQTKQI